MLGAPNRDRKTERRSGTRREIIDAAWRVAREKGLAHVTLREVAGLVGMRAPSLYTHFASKNAIYDAMFGDAWTQFLEYIEAAESGAPTNSRAAMRYYARVYFDFAVAFPARHELMSLRTIPDFTPTAEGYAPSVAVMEGFVARMARHGVSSRTTSTCSSRSSAAWSTPSSPTIRVATGGPGSWTAPLTCSPTTSASPPRGADRERHRDA
jgi:AcrR family transcriptional regulator